MRTLLLVLCCCMLFLGGTTVRGAVPHDNCMLTEVAQHRTKQHKPKHLNSPSLKWIHTLSLCFFDFMVAKLRPVCALSMPLSSADSGSLDAK